VKIIVRPRDQIPDFQASDLNLNPKIPVLMHDGQVVSRTERRSEIGSQNQRKEYGPLPEQK
jgi:hypothetical protein